MIPVNRFWINKLGFTPKPNAKKMKQKPPEGKNTKQDKGLSKTKVTHINKKTEYNPEVPHNETIDDFDSPPLFANGKTEFHQY